MALGRIIAGGPRALGTVPNRCLRLRQFPTHRLKNRRMRSNGRGFPPDSPIKPTRARSPTSTQLTRHHKRYPFLTL
jgi:hypothetical protein